MAQTGRETDNGPTARDGGHGEKKGKHLLGTRPSCWTGASAAAYERPLVAVAGWPGSGLRTGGGPRVLGAGDGGGRFPCGRQAEESQLQGEQGLIREAFVENWLFFFFISCRILSA